MRRSIPVGCALVAVIVAYSWSRAQPPMPPAPVVVASVVVQEVAGGVTLVGTVRPVRTSMIGAAVDGRVEDFPVTEGQRVKKGQLLAKLRTGTLEIERAAAQAELKLREEELREMRNGMRPEEKKFAKAKYDVCKSRYDRVKALHARGGRRRIARSDCRVRASRCQLGDGPRRSTRRKDQAGRGPHGHATRSRAQTR
jgi:multidrug efflux pump subunit AcrA (membrane-fusion protein)